MSVGGLEAALQRPPTGRVDHLRAEPEPRDISRRSVHHGVLEARRNGPSEPVAMRDGVFHNAVPCGVRRNGMLAVVCAVRRRRRGRLALFVSPTASWARILCLPDAPRGRRDEHQEDDGLAQLAAASVAASMGQRATDVGTVAAAS